MINLEAPKKAGALINQAYQAAAEVFRPISRKYDRAEHTYPSELDMFAALLDGLNSSGEGGAGAAGDRRFPCAKNKKGRRHRAQPQKGVCRAEGCSGGGRP